MVGVHMIEHNMDRLSVLGGIDTPDLRICTGRQKHLGIFLFSKHFQRGVWEMAITLGEVMAWLYLRL
jgi:hypothetical protein